MLEYFLSKQEEIEAFFQQLGDLHLFEIKQWGNKSNSIIFKFEYLSKRKKKYYFLVNFVFMPDKLIVRQNLNLMGQKTIFEVRLIFSEVIDFFIEKILLEFHPAAYIKVMQVPVQYPASYLRKDNRPKKQKEGW